MFMEWGNMRVFKPKTVHFFGLTLSLPEVGQISAKFDKNCKFHFVKC